jgi:phosphohistidine phosphatase
MYVTLIRHGTAGPAAADHLRSLTESGRAEAEALGRALHAREIRFDRMVASPLVRARQTAEAVARQVGLGVTLREDAGLVPEGYSDDVVALLRTLEAEGSKDVALVFHMPLIAMAAGVLLGEKVGGFKTAQALRLELTGNGSSWMSDRGIWIDPNGG